MSGVPINSGTGPSIAATLVGTDYVQLVSVANTVLPITGTVSVGVASINATTGTFSITGPVFVTNTGPFVVASLTTGTTNVVNVLSASGVTVASIATGTMNVINVLSASGVTVASVATGTMNVVNVLSASGVTIASVATGTVNASLMATTAIAGAFVQTAHASNFNAQVIVTSSANAIVLTSGANTIYVKDVVISVNTAMNVILFSAATTKMGPLYFATQGGARLSFGSAVILNSAQSLTVTPSVSGSCTVFVAGYTVT